MTILYSYSTEYPICQTYISNTPVTFVYFIHYILFQLFHYTSSALTMIVTSKFYCTYKKYLLCGVSIYTHKINMY